MGPTREECVEALTVMLERYGRKHTLEMLEEAQAILRKEAEARGDC